MKNKVEEQPKEYFERNTPFSIILLTVGLGLCWLSYTIVITPNPWGLMIAVPGIVFVLQAAWLLMNPYALLFDDRIQIKQSLIYDKDFYFIDAKALQTTTNTTWHFVYNDDELAPISLKGMRQSEKEKFKARMIEKINESLTTRAN